ncbi:MULTISPECIES: C-3',4' desaturase CrtD [Spirulina sp. CCY15215]|uniref:C-3',4' desaturase CrtD n=1 Tax=Spirulina sp. CCY15215 TaxID=2767591 RepID=UPI00194FE03D|nr:C-3',4' desaturase CrtD [Spirulina major]
MSDVQIKARSSRTRSAIAIGGGIGGLTTGALLAHQGYQVRVFDQAIVPGGCASTFQRKGFIFDVGATQVAGLEVGGIHHRIFTELGVELPEATYCDPACAVFLPGEKEPINIWRDREKWRKERQKQFPGSAPFWQLMNKLFQVSWKFQSRDPVLPPRNVWDMQQLLSAIRLDTLITVPFTLITVGDALRLLGLSENRRLRTFLDMQLKLYSQVNADETALLYAATALGVSQAPQGLYHLEGSMQVLSDRLVEALKKYGGELQMRHRVEKIHVKKGQATGVTIRNLKTGEVWEEEAEEIIANVTVQNLQELVEDKARSQSPLSPFFPPTSFLNWKEYQYRIDKLPSPSGAFVVYLGVDRAAIPENCPPHLQFLYDYAGEIGENNSLFVSVSKPGDGRAPEGQGTIIASSFVDTRQWWQGSKENYEQLKEKYTREAIARLGEYFHLTSATILHQEVATPRTFAHFTGRKEGYVGGVGQRLSTFGPFGFGTRTPIQHLWLVGDSTHPGEGTAGVSYSGLTAVRQICTQ